MDKKVELALEAIKASRGTESGEYGIDLFVSHHLDELPAAVWLEILGKENPSFDDILSALVVAYVEDDVCDFTLPNDVTNYLISVSFDENGQVIDISMESWECKHNKLFKSDSQRVAFLLCVGFGV